MVHWHLAVVLAPVSVLLYIIKARIKHYCRLTGWFVLCPCCCAALPATGPQGTANASVEIANVQAGSAADEAKLSTGYQIFHINGRVANTMTLEEVKDEIRNSPDTLDLTVHFTRRQTRLSQDLLQ